MIAPQTELLNSLARDLDHMLNDLCHDPDQVRAVNNKNQNSRQARSTSQSDQLTSSPDMTADQKKLLQLNNNRNQEDSAMSSSCSELEPCPPAEMSVTERLIRSLPVWFLPGIHRAGAEHLLQGKPPGTFIVRESSNAASMALSVRLPAGKGPHVEHFLIEKHNGKLSLESSENRFSDISSLIACYSSRCDELPVQLRLPDSLQQAESRHQLSSRALLGQEFWQSRLASCSPGGSTGASGSTQSSTASSSLNKVGGSQSSLGSLCSPPGAPAPPQTETLTSQSSLGSSSGPPPADSPLTTFGRRLSARPGEGRASPATPTALGCITEGQAEGGRRPAAQPRPTPPSSLPLQPARLSSPALVSRVSSPVGGEPAGRAAPPRPPPRWCKPSLTPPAVSAMQTGGAFRGEVITLRGPAAAGRQVRSASNTPVRELTPGTGAPWRPTCASPATTPASCDDDVLLPGAAPRASRRRGRKKRSTHYQEADILELPAGFCRSAVADKISDYEDIWASPPREIPESTFKPRTAARSMNDLSDAACGEAPAAAAAADRAGLRLELHPPRAAAASLRSPRSPATSSPFYATPADAVRPASEAVCSAADPVVQRRAPFDRTAAHRHSEPNIRWEPPGRGRRPAAARLETIDSSDELPALSSSVDNLASAPRRLRAGARSQSSHGLGEAARRGKAVPPPRVHSPRRPRPRRAARGWRVDADWAFVGADNEGFEADTEAEADEGAVQLRRPPAEARNLALRLSESTESEAAGPPALTKEEESRIVQAYIRQSLPQVVSTAAAPVDLPPPDPSVSASDYDNVRPLTEPPPPPPAPAPAPAAVAGTPAPAAGAPVPDATETSKWESIMRLMNDQLRLRTGQFDEPTEERPFTDSESFVHVRQAAAVDDSATSESTVAKLETQLLPRSRAPQESLYSPPRLTSLRLHRRSQQSGSAIREYVLKLSADHSNTFALNVQKFLQCTREASETEPHVVMRNTRQFVNGMKNYLVKHGEGDFHQIVDQERNKLASTTFLNLDVILEGVLEELLVRPLYEHFKHLATEGNRRDGAIQRLTENLEFARGRSAASLGVKPERPPPAAETLDAIRATMTQLEAAVSPLDKLEHLLSVISDVFAAAGAKEASLPADELLPLLVYTLAHCHCTTAEFEADYMWGLLHPMLLNGEAGYYLTMLSSAVHVLKNLQHYLDDRSRGSTRSLSHCSGSVSGSEPVDGLLRVVIPDEQQGTIISRTLPARPTTSSRDVCKMLGNKLRITSPTDYGLFKLIDGNETLLGDQECPQHIKQELATKGTHCMLAYKRLDAKIAWPTAQL